MMKHKYHLTVGIVAMVANAAFGSDPIGSAIYSEFPLNGGQTFIPASFSKDEIPMLTFSDFNSENGTTEIQIVDSSLEKVAELNVPANPEALEEKKEGFDLYKMHWISMVRDTLDRETLDLKSYLDEHNYNMTMEYITAKGYIEGLVYFNEDTSFDVLSDGFRAIKQFLIDSKELVQVTCEGECELTTSFFYYPELYPWHRYSNGDVITIPCYDYDNSGSTIDWISLTQTLFNDDEQFEYISPIFKTYSKLISSDTPNYKYLWDLGDFAYESRYECENYPVACIGFAIKNESGNILQTINFDDGIETYLKDFMSLIVIGGKKYLSCSVRGEESFRNMLYSINKDGNGVKQVASFKTNVHPTVVSRNENVQVDIEESHKSNLSVEACDVSGKVLYNRRIKSGESRISIPASSLSGGINMVTVSDGLHKSSTKVLVK